jgi:hypothetical protein
MQPCASALWPDLPALVFFPPLYHSFPVSPTSISKTGFSLISKHATLIGTYDEMTRFRPCIDLHAGQVKQIVGGTLGTEESKLKTNFVSKHPAGYYSELYREANLLGAHVIMLGPGNEEAAREALAAWPGHLQVGGGITDANAIEWIEAGAEKVCSLYLALHGNFTGIPAFPMFSGCTFLKKDGTVGHHHLVSLPQRPLLAGATESCAVGVRKRQIQACRRPQLSAKG